MTLGLPTRARKLGTAGLIWRKIRRHGRLVGIAAVCLVMAGIMSAYFMFRSRDPDVVGSDRKQDGAWDGRR
ncbi:MAG: hypothetical protein U0903_06570 [Planctomycetales bacterium]